MCALAYTIALGVNSVGGGNGEDASPPVQRFAQAESPPETSGLLHFLFKTVRDALNDMVSNYVAEMQGENYF